jgi:V-type H+-transporting ATPase proteolipid subunit
MSVLDASLTYSVQCPPTAPLLGYSGAALAVIFSSIGAAYGTCKSGVGIAGMGVNNPGQVMKALIPVVMAGVIGIYGLIVCVIISTSIEAPSNQNFNPKYSLFTGCGHFFAGLTIGLSGLAAGVCVGVVGDAGVRGFGQEPRLFVGQRIDCTQFVFMQLICFQE